jgi:hypothetical protein
MTRPKPEFGFVPQKILIAYLLSYNYVKYAHIMNYGHEGSRNKGHLGYPSRRRDDNIIIDLKQVGLKKTM